MRMKINSLVNIVTGSHSRAMTGTCQITVPHLRLRLSIDEADRLAEALREAVDVVTEAEDPVLVAELEGRNP